jgi:tetratricopeptide (TPR) repeat protein
MRAYLLSLAGLVAALSPAAPASAYNYTYGSTLANSCYRLSKAMYGSLEGVRTCDRAIDEEGLSPPDYLATLVNRGIIKMNSSSFATADADFDRAISLDANYPEAYLNKAFLRLRQNQPSVAIELLDRSLERQTREPALAFYARGVANEQLGRLRAAYEDFRKAQQLAPTWSLPSEELARYSLRGR